MRRKDREVSDFKEIVRIIDECEILRLGLADGDCPYIVPVNFAYTVEGTQICLYIHGAKAGRKYELLRRNPLCSFEMDLPLGIECIAAAGDATERYKCVMGTAAVEFLEGEEKQAAIDRIIMARNEKTRDFAYDQRVVPQTAIARLRVTSITAKANLPGTGPDA